MARDSWLKRLIWLRGSPAGGSGASYEKTVGPAPIISISDAKAKPAKSLMVGMEPIQDLHGYDNPWPAGGGKNKYDESSVTYGKWTSGSGVVSDAAYGCISAPIYLASGSCYIRAFGVSPNSMSVCEYKSDNSFITRTHGTISTLSVTLNANTAYIIVQFAVTTSATMTEEILKGYKIAVADSNVLPNAWTPYSNECPITGRTEANIYRYAEYDADAQPTYTIQLGQTVYGCTVDVVSGLLTVTHISEMYEGSSDEGWTTSGSGNYVAKAPLMLGGSKPISSAYAMETSPATGEFKIQPINNNLDYASLAEWKAYLAETPLQVVYELATPQTYQLTPQQIQLLKGSNVLWSDADNLTLTYLGTNPPNLLGGMLGGGLGGGYTPPAEQDPEELTEPETTETDVPAEETPAEEGENNGE